MNLSIKTPKIGHINHSNPLTRNAEIDANGDEKVTKKEVKKSWDFDRYRQSDADVRKAVENTSNLLKESLVKRYKGYRSTISLSHPLRCD
jgi:hypothetical protein